MSASLVGSEMCIRDRGLPVQNLGHECGATRPPGRICRRRAPQDPYVPVSYTHLTLPTICSV
eukprot:4154253-Alexandrium_andersonii.AAC.1